MGSFRFKNYVRIVSCSPMYSASFEDKLQLSVRPSLIQQDSNYHRYCPFGPGPLRASAYYTDSMYWEEGSRAVCGATTKSGPALKMHQAIFKQSQIKRLELFQSWKANFFKMTPKSDLVCRVVNVMERCVRVGELFQFQLCEESGLMASSKVFSLRSALRAKIVDEGPEP